MATDGGLYPRFKANLPGHWVRVESGWTSAGVPDAEYCLRGGDAGWVEFKEARGGRVTVRTLQASFAHARALAGGRATMAALVGDALELHEGSGMRQMLLHRDSRPVKGGRSVPLGCFRPLLRLEPPWDWRAVERALRR